MTVFVVGTIQWPWGLQGFSCLNLGGCCVWSSLVAGAASEAMELARSWRFSRHDERNQATPSLP
eukprot:scaffold5880_cov32-Tisochrysis_lutea.AAC.12